MQASGGATESYRVSVVRYRDGCAMVVEFVAFFGFGPRACDLNCSGWAVVGAGGGFCGVRLRGYSGDPTWHDLVSPNTQ